MNPLPKPCLHSLLSSFWDEIEKGSVGEGQIVVAMWLLSIGVPVDQADHAGWTALSWATKRGHWLMAKRLLEKGASVDVADHQGFTPLASAAENGDLPMVKLLVSSGADVAGKTREGKPFAELSSSPEIKQYLQPLITKTYAISYNIIRSHNMYVISYMSRKRPEEWSGGRDAVAQLSPSGDLCSSLGLCCWLPAAGGEGEVGKDGKESGEWLG